MSLISLSSSSKDDLVQQSPFNFKNHFPQPLIIKPNSQVALLNFYHYRDDGYYRINSHNNIIAFALGDARVVGYHYAKVESGRYDDGTALAAAVVTALNNAVVQQNYAFTATFTQGNPTANPVQFDQFAITYDNVTAPASKGGSWSKLAGESQNELQITNNDTDTGESVIEAKVGQTVEASGMMLRGELTHEGTYRAFGISKVGSNDGSAVTLDSNLLRGCNIGLVRKQFSKLNTGNPQADYSSEFADIKVQVKSDPATANEHSITVSTLKQRQGSTNILAPNGKVQQVRRVIDDAFIDANFKNDDLMGFEFAVISTSRSVLVRLLKSTDGGITYTYMAESADNNTDGAKNVYDQTINGFNYTGIIYNSNGVLNNAGTGVIAGTLSANLITPKYAPFVPFINMDNDGVVISGAEFDNCKLFSTFADATFNFVMEIKNDLVGLNAALDYGFDIFTAAQDNGPVRDTDIFDCGIKKNLFDTRGFLYDLHSSSTNAPTAANKIGTMTFSSSADGTSGTCIFTGLDVSPFTMTINPLPVLSFTPWKMYLSGVFNHTLQNSQVGAGGEEITNTTSTHDESTHTETGDPGIKVGADLPTRSTILLNRINQADVTAGAAAPSRLTNDLPSGNIGPTIGFRQNFISNNTVTTTITGDAETTKISQDNNIHISIPELSGVKSFEGEANNTGKTIKVLPKNEFTSNDDTGSMTFTANYEDYININNAEELRLNELTVQVRNPDGKMSIALQPTTRATIKIREDPRIREDKRMENLARNLSQRQDTGRDLTVLNNRVGS